MGYMCNIGAVLFCLLPATGIAHAQAGLPDAGTEARALVARMQDSEISSLLVGHVGIDLGVLGGAASAPPPEGSRQSAGFVPGIARLGISPLWMTDAMLGVGNLRDRMRPGDTATAFPSTLLLAASFDDALAEQMGAAIGREAHQKGYNVLLGPGLNLIREPRNGRNFEYFSEDPLLTGRAGGAMIRGIQSRHVVATAKHFALNSTQVNQNTLDAQMAEAPLRESDLLAFQIAIETGRPGSVMCSYNAVNGRSACNNPWLLDHVLKRQWGFQGWVMSDWGGTKAADFADAGLDQQSGAELSAQEWFGAPLQERVAKGLTSRARFEDMATRIVRAQKEIGVDRHPASRTEDFDPKPGAAVALDVARRGIVLLRNDGILPLKPDVQLVALIGGYADRGVLRGSGSSEVTPTNGRLLAVPSFDESGYEAVRNPTFLPSSPMAALQRRLETAMITYDPGTHARDAALAARRAQVAIVFVWRHETETRDSTDMNLPLGQNELVEAVLAANPNTIVVVQSGNPVLLPWAHKARAILWAGFPGQEGGQAIADVLTGDVNPSGRLPVSFPASEAQLPFPELPNLGADFFKPVSVNYREGADVGYRWFAARGSRPLFAFGHGLSYTDFSLSHPKLSRTAPWSATIRVKNVGARAGIATPQLYVTERPQGETLRLAAYGSVPLKPGEERTVRLALEPRVIADFDTGQQQWVVRAGRYRFAAGTASDNLSVTVQADLSQLRLAP